MRKILVLLSTCMLTTQALTADFCGGCEGWPAAGVACTLGWPSPFKLDLSGGFRQDKFEWSIAGAPEQQPDGDFEDFPNVLSELRWKNLRMAEIEGQATYVSCRNYAVRLTGNYGRIYYGRVDDLDYAGDDRTDLTSFSSNNASRGHVYDWSAAGGYRVTSNCMRLYAIPMIGYSQHSQYLHLFDGHQIFPFDFRFPGLDSRYTTRWFGPFAAVDFEARVERCAFLFGSFEWHMLSYRAHGRWNLRPDLGRFNHKAYGFGYLARLGAKWEIWNNWAIGVQGSYRMFRTRHGHEHNKVIDPFLGPIFVTARFNGAQWHSFSVAATVSWRF